MRGGDVLGRLQREIKLYVLQATCTCKCSNHHEIEESIMKSSDNTYFAALDCTSFILSMKNLFNFLTIFFVHF